MKHLPKFALFTALILAGSILYKGYAKNLRYGANEKVLTAYNGQLIPTFQKKAHLVRALLKQSLVSDHEVEGILSHVSAWHARSSNDMKEMDEIASYLDTHLSSHAAKFQELAKRDYQIASTLQQLQSLEDSILKIRKTL